MSFGLVFGSFANVVIWRFPRGESLSHPDSHCPMCETPILWRDNIPVLSWLLLRGKCRACGVPISPRYPSVELISGLLWLAAGVRFGMSAQTGFAVVFFYLLMILTFIDLDTMRLPNPIVGLLALVGIAGALLGQFTDLAAVPLLAGSTPFGGAPLAAVVFGGLACSVPALALSIVMAAILKRPALGMGDVKLLGVMGMYLGLYGLLALFIGSLMGAIYGIVAGMREPKDDSDGVQVTTEADDDFRGSTDSESDSDTTTDSDTLVASALRRGKPFPFGPALSTAAVIVTLAGPQIWEWYQSLFMM